MRQVLFSCEGVGGSDRLRVSFTFDHRIVNALKTVGFWFKPSKKFWHGPFTPIALEAAIKAIKAEIGEFSPVMSDAQTQELARAPVHLRDVNVAPLPHSVRKPWSHQPTGAHAIGQMAGVILNWDVGSGKSKAVLDAIVHYNFKRTLVVCPVKAIDKVWQREPMRHVPPDYELDVLLLGPQTQLVRNRSIGKPRRAKSIDDRAEALAEVLREVKSSGHSLLVAVNFDVLWNTRHEAPKEGDNPKKKKPPRRNSLADALADVQWDLVVVDESHRIANTRMRSGVQAGRWLCQRVRARHRVCMSGTVLPNGPIDAYGQCMFVDAGLFGQSIARFRSRYAVMGGYAGQQILDYTNLDEFREKLSKICHRVRIDDVVDLPEQTDEDIVFDLSPEASEAYNAMRDKMLVEHEQGVATVDNVLTKLLRMQQITSGFIELVDETTGEKRHVVLDDGRMEEAIDLFQDSAADQPWVAFALFKPDLTALKVAASKAGRKAFEVSGAADEYAAWERSCDLGEGPVIVVQIQAGGEAIDLTRACYCLFYSVDASRRKYVQARGRVRRPGQTRPCIYYHMIARSIRNGVPRNTIDEVMYGKIEDKQRVVDLVIEHLQSERKPETEKKALHS